MPQAFGQEATGDPEVLRDLAIFVLLPLFYGITSHGNAQLQVFGRRLPPRQ